VTAALISAKTS